MSCEIQCVINAIRVKLHRHDKVGLARLRVALAEARQSNQSQPIGVTCSRLDRRRQPRLCIEKRLGAIPDRLPVVRSIVEAGHFQAKAEQPGVRLAEIRFIDQGGLPTQHGLGQIPEENEQPADFDEVPGIVASVPRLAVKSNSRLNITLVLRLLRQLHEIDRITLFDLTEHQRR